MTVDIAPAILAALLASTAVAAVSCKVTLAALLVSTAAVAVSCKVTLAALLVSIALASVVEILVFS